MKTTPDSPQNLLPNRMIVISCLAAILGLVACQQEGSAEKAGQKIDKAVDNVGQNIEQTAEMADNKMDSIKESVTQQVEKTGTYLEESKHTANNELEKAGQAIDKAINNTGKRLAGAKDAVVDAASTTGEFIDDSAITTQIKAAMISDEYLKASVIEVTTVNGVVTLKGSLDSEQLLGRAIGLVNSQQGVKSVQNELMVNASVPSKQ
ncbi:MAG: BON domain-containing protein [Methylomonas sp.]|jgi:hyperosmotically inducible protein|uniref:BON domain-containing protein n=1 Tax=Methylomonas sp. TaxID=418 RepID=UPI0025DAE953|nr:BON domain-containing protein [Methylomonas sp.]MCK9605365.1 BON domain-containing protein [Methylomonas sp.]